MHSTTADTVAVTACRGGTSSNLTITSWTYSLTSGSVKGSITITVTPHVHR